VFGIGLWPYVSRERTEPRFGGELDVPITRNLNLLLRGQVGSGARGQQYSVGTGIQLRFAE
jgi:hypothetical protein